MNTSKLNNSLRPPTAKECFLVILLLLCVGPCWGHGMGGTGLMHPLTGVDHLLAMLAVGAWSAQRGGRSIYRVPACLASLMVLGGIAGVVYPATPYTETAIALSILLLGLAISLDQPMSGLVAGFGVGLFGFSHGFAHGSEMHRTVEVTEVTAYMTGFLVTTGGLHLIGALGGLLLLEETQGRAYLRRFGLATSFIGLYLLMH